MRPNCYQGCSIKLWIRKQPRCCSWSCKDSAVTDGQNRLTRLRKKKSLLSVNNYKCLRKYWNSYNSINHFNSFLYCLTSIEIMQYNLLLSSYILSWYLSPTVRYLQHLQFYSSPSKCGCLDNAFIFRGHRAIIMEHLINI